MASSPESAGLQTPPGAPAPPGPENPAQPADAPPRLSLRLKIVFMLFILLVGLVGAELAVRVRDMTKGLGFFNPRRNKLYNTPDAIVPFRIFGVRPYKVPDKISSRWDEQFQFVKPAGTFRIICMGGSTTEDKSNQKVRWPNELGRLLRERLKRENIEVINIGNSAYATPHLLIHLELDVLSWQPDLVIASENINDLLVNWFPDFKPDYSPAYSDPYFAVPDYTKNFTVAAVLLQHFQLYWLLVDRLEWMDLAGRFKMRRAAWGDKPLPGLEIFKRNWRSFVTLAQANRIPVLLASQALEPSQAKFDLHNGLKPYNWKMTYPLHEEFLKQHQLYNRAIEEIAAEKQALFLDNDAALGGNPDYFMDHVHYTEAGSRRLAESYADFLIANGVVK